MPTHEKKYATVIIGGQLVPYPRAALVAVKADRFHIVPHKALHHVRSPKELPENVEIAGVTLSLWAAALIAQEADAENTTPAQYLIGRLEAYAASLGEPPLRSRRRGERRRIVAAWVRRTVR